MEEWKLTNDEIGEIAEYVYCARTGTDIKGDEATAYMDGIFKMLMRFGATDLYIDWLESRIWDRVDDIIEGVA